jgi:plastocyanin
MARFQAGCTVLLALAFATGCTKDSPSGGDQLVAPDASGDAMASSGSGSDRDSDGPGGRRFIAIRDDCDPRDPAWDPTGGCLLRRGNVRFAEFADELDSPLSIAVVGHQAWRNDPPYLVIKAGKTIRVRNEGGRVHTFTKVAEFGGGKVPPPGGVGLNKGLVLAPECPGSVDIPPGESMRVSGLTPGNHRFECCIHPWMRAIIKVKTD